MGTPVSSVMTRDVVTVAPDDSWLTAVRSISEHHVHALPVVDADRRVVGVVAESDLTLKEERLDRASAPVFQRRRDRLRAGGRTVADVMGRHPVTAEPDTTLGEAARLMHRRHVGRPTGRGRGPARRRDRDPQRPALGVPPGAMTTWRRQSARRCRSCLPAEST
jgi:CBS domain-containing protein